MSDVTKQDQKNDGDPSIPEPTQPVPTTANVLGAVGTITINFDEIKPNSLLVIKVNPETPQQRAMVTQQIAMALKPLRDIIRGKNLALVVMGLDESIEMVDEAQMAAIGWQRKGSSGLMLPGRDF